MRTSWQQRTADQQAALHEAALALFDAWHPAAGERIAALDRQVVRTEVRDMGRTPAEVAAHRAQAIRNAHEARRFTRAKTVGAAFYSAGILGASERADYPDESAK